MATTRKTRSSREQNTQNPPPVAHNSLETAFHPNEAGWSVTNLPNALFRLEPPEDWGHEAALPAWKNSEGGLRSDSRGQPLKDFPFLPFQISRDPEYYRLEMYLGRLHSKCSTTDVFARMNPAPGEKVPLPNAINMNRLRLRNRLNIPCWTRRRESHSLLECLIHEQVSWASVKWNTVLPVGALGLVKPKLTDDARAEVPFLSYYTPRDATAVPHTIIPMTTYTNQPLHIPSPRLESVFDTIAELQALAFEKGYPHWIFLKNRHKPEKWSQKAVNQKNPNSGPNEISVPECSGLPTIAVTWIEFCIGQAVMNGEMGLPLERLPTHVCDWILPVITWAKDQPKGELGHEPRLDKDNEDNIESSESTDIDLGDLDAVEAEFDAEYPAYATGQPVHFSPRFDHISNHDQEMMYGMHWNYEMRDEMGDIRIGHQPRWGEPGIGQPSGFTATEVTGYEHTQPPVPNGTVAPGESMDRGETTREWVLDQREVVAIAPYYPFPSFMDPIEGVMRGPYYSSEARGNPIDGADSGPHYSSEAVMDPFDGLETQDMLLQSPNRNF